MSTFLGMIINIALIGLCIVFIITHIHKDAIEHGVGEYGTNGIFKWKKCDSYHVTEKEFEEIK